jgi:hypothetical protein
VIRLDRTRRAGPLLELKVTLFAVAAVLGLAGIYLDERWLTGAAIAVLLGAVLLRFAPGGAPRLDDDDDAEDAAEDPDPG